MLRPRRLDQEGLQAYLDDIRPRFLILRVRAEKANIVWGVPLWAAEEIAAFALGAVAILKEVHPYMPKAWREKLNPAVTAGGRVVKLGPDASNDYSAESHGNPLAEVFRTVDALAGGSLRDVLRLPPGEPYVKVSTETAYIEIAAY